MDLNPYVTKDRATKLSIITDNDLVRATNIGFIASRFMARGADKRALPHLSYYELIDQWIDKLTDIEKFEPEDKIDRAGDTYYFWTQLYATLMLSLLNDVTAKPLLLLYPYANPLMVFFRNYVARQPVITKHREACRYGKTHWYIFSVFSSWSKIVCR